METTKKLSLDDIFGKASAPASSEAVKSIDDIFGHKEAATPVAPYGTMTDEIRGVSHAPADLIGVSPQPAIIGENELQKNRADFEKELKSMAGAIQPTQDSFKPMSADAFKVGGDVTMPGAVDKPKSLSQTVQSEINKRWGGDLQSIIDKARSVNPENVNLAEDMESHFWKVMKDKVPSDSFITQEDLDGFKFTRDYSNGDKDIEYSFGHYTYPQEVVNEYVARHNDEVLHNMRFKEEPEYRNEWFLRNVGVTEQAYRDEVAADLENRLQELRKKVVATLPAQHTRGGYAAIGAAANKPSSGASVSIEKIDMALKTVNTLRKNSFGAGLKEGFDLADILTLGVSGIGENVALLNALNKSASGKTLTTSEQALVEAWDIQNEAEEVMQVLGGRSLASNIGRGGAQSLGFITQTVGTGGLASAATKGITRAAAKSTLKRVASTGVASKIQEGVRYGSLKAAESLVGAAARTPFMGFTYRNYTDKRLNQFQVNERVDEATGEISKYIDKQESSALRDAAHAALESYFESQSEDVGGLIDFGITSFARALPIKQFIRSSVVNGMTGAVKNGAMKWIKESAKIYGLAGEVLSEAYGDAAVNLLTSNTDGWKQMASSEYWWELLGVSSMLSGGFGVVNRAVNSYSGRNLDRQIAHEDNNRRNALSRIEDDMLKKELTEVSLTDDLIERSKMLSSLDWSNFTKEDMANTIDFISAQTRLDVMRESDMESRRLSRIMPAIDEVKTLADNGALDEDQAAASLAVIYSNLFRTQENKRALNILTDRIKVAADAGISADEINEILRGAGLTVFNPGDEIETLTGDRAIVDKVLPGAYEVVNNEGDRAVVSFEEVLQNTPEVRQIQQESNQTEGQLESALENNPQVEQAVESARQEAEVIKNLDDDVIYEATLSDGTPVNIIKGANIVYNNQTGEVDYDASDATVVVRSNDGSKRQISIREIDSIDQAMSVDESLEVATAAATEVVNSQEQAETPTAEVVSTQDEVPSAQGAEAATVEQLSESPANQPEEQPQIPLLKNGEPDYNAMDARMFAEQYVARFGEDMTERVARNNIKASNKAIATIEKQIEDVTDPNKMPALYSKLQDAQATKDKYSAVLEELGLSADESEDNAARIQRKKQENTPWFNKLFPDGFPNVESVILWDIANGNRIRWTNKEVNGAVVSKGLGSHLGLADSNAERTRRVALIGKDAPTPEEYAEQLPERLNAMGIRFEESELLDKVLDVYASVDTVRKAKEELEKISANIQSEQEGLDYEEEQMRRNYEREQEALRQEAQADVVDEQTEQEQPINEETQEEELSIEDEVPFMVSSDSVQATNEAQQLATEAAITALEDAGVEVVNATPEMVEEALQRKDVQMQSVNQKFNEQLDSFTEENANAVIFDLGMPSPMLIAGGVPNKPIRLYGSKLLKKIRKHGFSATELRGLPMALANPIAVFNNYQREGNRSVLTELSTADGNFLVSIDIGMGTDIDFDIVKSVFGKDGDGILNWINKGYLTTVDKEKALAYLRISAPIAEASNKQELDSATKIVENFENPNIVPANSFAVENPSLVGLHNISEEKLRKAFRLGGLANPSVAVIDSNSQKHTGYGDITLVLPSAMIAKKTGKNIGTYFGDAWTPTYPEVQKQLGNNRASQDIMELPDGMQNSVRLALNSWLDGRSGDSLSYMFLHQRGDAPEIHRTQSKFSPELHEAMTQITGGQDFYYLNDEERNRVLDLYVQEKHDGSRDKFNAHMRRVIERGNRLIEERGENSLIGRKAKEAIDAINEYGYDYDSVSGFVRDVHCDMEYSGKVDPQYTLLLAERKVKENGLESAFAQWLDSLEDRYAIKEVIFKGYTPSGNRRYIPNTLENASKEMRLQGRAGATGLSIGFSNFAARLLQPGVTLDDIRKRKRQLKTSIEEVDAFKDKWSSVMFDLGEKCQPNATGYEDYGLERLAEAATKNDPQAYLKSEYGVDLSDEDVKRLKDMVKAIRTEYPVMYFETKFERPVYFNEFAGAVVPDNTSADVVQSLKDAGIPVWTYAASDENARMDAIKNIANSSNDIFFSIGPAPVFVSNAKIAVLGIKQEKATPEQWLKMIEKAGGMKAGEDKWIGLSDWLKASDKKTLTKQEVLDYINENQIQIEETTYSGNNTVETTPEFKTLQEEFRAIADNYIAQSRRNLEEFEARMAQKYGFTDVFDTTALNEDEERAHVSLSRAVDESYNAAWTEMVERYGDDFEIAFWNFGDGVIKVDNAEAASALLGLPIDKPIYHVREDYTTKGLEGNREIALTVPNIESWRETDEIHFGDAGDGRAIAWVRFGETTDSDGKRVLVIDEIQSKRHQEGRERGYGFVGDVAKAREDADEAYRKVVSFENDMTSKYGDQYWTGDATNEEVAHWELLRSELDRLGLIYENIAEKQRKSVPEAPFEKNWAELAMKRMLRYAAENGFDKVAWTKGDQQAERYSLGAVLQGLKAYKTSPNTYYVIPYNNGAIGEFVKEYTEKELADTFGKELAAKIIANTENATEDNPYEIEGDGLRIGGEGMRAFYDQMLPSFMRKYGKKWGATVQDVTLPNVEKAGRTMHSVNVTDSMRDSVMQGQPMFYRRPNGTVYGWTNGTTVYLTESGMNPNTPIHEYTHIWAAAMKKHNPEGWKSILKLLKGTPVWNEVMADANYANIHGNEHKVASEALSRISGRENAAKMEAMAQQMIDENANDTVKKNRARKLLDRMRKALQEFWSWVGKELFGIKNFERIEQVTDRILYDLVSGTDLTSVSSFDTPAAEHAEEVTSEAQKIADKFGLSNEIVVAETQYDYIREIKSEGIRDEDINLDTYAVYMPSGRIIVNAEAADNMAELSDSIMHEFAHNVTRGGDMLYRLQDTVLEVGEERFEAAGREIFGQTTDPLVVADEIIANFVGASADPTLYEGTDLLGGVISGRYTSDEVIDMLQATLFNNLRDEYADVFEAVRPYVKEVIVTIQTNHNGPKETRRVRIASRENREDQVDAINGLQPNAGDENVQTGDTSKVSPEEARGFSTTVPVFSGGQKTREGRSNDGSVLQGRGADSAEQTVRVGNNTLLEGVNEFSIGNGEEIDRRTHSEGEFVSTDTEWDNGTNLQPNARTDGERRYPGWFGTRTGATGTASDEGGQVGGGTRGDRANLAESNQTAKSDSRARLIAELRQKLRDVKAETRTVAAEVGKIVRKAITAELIDKMGKRTFDNIVRTIETATVRRDVEYAVNRIEEAVLDMELRDKQDKFDKYLNLRVQGESARGVSIAANVTDQVRQFITIIRDNLDRPASEVEALIEERGGSLAERTGLQVLGFYQDARNFEREVQEIEDEIEKIKSENTELRKKRAALNKAGKTNDAKNLSDQINANKETIEHLNAERISTKRSQLYYIDMAANELEREIAYGKEGHKGWLQKEAERKQELIKIAKDDIGDGKKIPILDKQEPIWKKAKNAVVEFLLAPAYSWDYLLKMISVNAPNGEGALYDHFMRSENGYVAASGNYYQAYEDFKARLNEKAKDIFGKDYKQVLKDSNQPLDVTIQISAQYANLQSTTDENKISEGASEIYTPTIGEVVYAYMAAKMPDGRVKLDKMGVKEDIIDYLVRQIPQGYITFADWVQNEFLPERRKVYNKTHLEVFGTQMAQVENYVPLKVKKDFVYEEFDGSKIDKAELPSSITGSIIKRKRNSLPIDLHTNIFDLLLDHGQQMEHWNAYTRIVRDTNQFLSNTKIRRALDYRKKGLHRKLKEAALIASNSYQPDVDRLEKMTVALNKMAASSKIAFRINTAIKQVLSYPAFYAYVADAHFWGYLTRNLGPDSWGRNFRWALDNIPSFQERWLGRMAGDERLAQMTSPKLDRWIKGMGNVGMLPNALVDAVTCANGAQAVYRYEHERYMKIGLDESEADRLAKIAAAQALNQTQQSSEGMYLSRIQADRTAFAVAISTFQNSNFAYLRKELEGIDQLMRDTKKQIANREKYYEQQGVNPDQAAKLALQDVVSANRTAVVKILVFGFILNTIWMLGNSVWKYAFGDEDEEDKWEDAAIRGFFNSFTRNLSVGQYVETFAWSDFRELNPSLLLSDLNMFIERLESIAEGNVKMWDRTAAWTVLSALSSLGLGVDINSFASMYEGVMGIMTSSHGVRLDADTAATIFRNSVGIRMSGGSVEDWMLFLNAPRSQAKFIAGPPKEGETLDEYTKRQAWIERKIVSRIDKKQLDKWSRNYEAYKQAEMLGVPYSRDKMGRVSVPYIKDIDDSYSALLKSVGRTKSGAKRNDGDSIADDVKTRIRDFGLIKRIKDVNALEKNLDTMVILDGAYPERLKELCEAKQQLIEEWNQ